MVNKFSELKNIPEKDHFKYLSAYNNFIKVKKELKDFSFDIIDKDKIDKLLRDYNKYFKILININDEFKKNPEKLYKIEV